MHEIRHARSINNSNQGQGSKKKKSSLDPNNYKDIDFGVFHDIGSPEKTKKTK